VLHDTILKHKAIVDQLQSGLSILGFKKVKNVMQMLYSFIQNSSVDDLFDFLSFTTGSRSSTTIFVPGSIAVSVRNTEAIFALTC